MDCFSTWKVSLLEVGFPYFPSIVSAGRSTVHPATYTTAEQVSCDTSGHTHTEEVDASNVKASVETLDESKDLATLPLCLVVTSLLRTL